MKLKVLLILVLMLALPTQTAAQAGDYCQAIQPNWYTTPAITWRLNAVPEEAFGLFWSGSGTWLAQDGSDMTIEIESIADDVVVRITLGNATWRANDTDLAKDLAIGVWGVTPWLPGFVIPISEQSVHELNTTAHASASRALGNYMNGTMNSYRKTLNVNGISYDCIVFNYEQDETGFGEPQHSELAYDLETGILVNGSTTYSFGVPYVLRLYLESLSNPRAYLLFGSVMVVMLAAVLAVAYHRRTTHRVSGSQ